MRVCFFLFCFFFGGGGYWFMLSAKKYRKTVSAGYTRGVPEIRGKVPLLYFCCLNSIKIHGHNTLTID